MAIKIDKIKLSCDDLSGIIVEPIFVDTYENFDSYIINIQRSMDKSSFTTIKLDLKSIDFKDTTAYLLDKRIDYYYRIEIMDKKDSSKSYSDIFEFKNNGDLDDFARAIIETQSLYLNNILNNEMKLFKIKKYGELCECNDDVREKPSNKRCPKCFGVGYAGGYYPPTDVKIGYFNAASTSERYELEDVSEQDSPIQIWSVPYPKFSVNDILADCDNNRFKIMNVQYINKGKTRVKQICQIVRVPETSIIYKVGDKNV